MSLLSFLLGGFGKDLETMQSVVFIAMFLPIFLLLYAIMPKKFKKYYLLIVSLLYYFLVSKVLIYYLLLTVILSHYFGLWLDRIKTKMTLVLNDTPKEEKKAVKQRYKRYQKRVMFFALFTFLMGLIIYVYAGFFANILNFVTGKLNIPIYFEAIKLLRPLGISFFTLQAMSYIIDVYRDVIEADENIFRLGLFISFFPQVVEGPICRYKQTAKQLWDVKQIEYKNLTFGMQRFVYGVFKYYLIAIRLHRFVGEIFEHYYRYGGGVIALGALCYTIELYANFSGTLDCVIGIAEIIGVKMPENFEQPFFSKTISEFWKRWHISLGAWFRDYLFYPITTSKRMKKITSSARKKIGNHYGPLVASSIALFCVWFCNGLWHGAAFNYLFFGMYHFAFILFGNMINPIVKKTNQKFKINSNSFWYRGLQIIRTCIIVVIGELFFKSNGLRNALSMVKRIIFKFNFSEINNCIKESAMEIPDFGIIVVTLVIIFIVSLLNERKKPVREIVANKNIFVRWAFWYGVLIFIVIFGAYGYGYSKVDPMYAQF